MIFFTLYSLQVLLLSWWLEMQWAIRVDSAAYGESKALKDSDYITQEDLLSHKPNKTQ